MSSFAQDCSAPVDLADAGASDRPTVAFDLTNDRASTATTLHRAHPRSASGPRHRPERRRHHHRHRPAPRTGTVLFTDGTVPGSPRTLGSASVDDTGRAALTAEGLGAGTHHLTATCDRSTGTLDQAVDDAVVPAAVLTGPFLPHAVKGLPFTPQPKASGGGGPLRAGQAPTLHQHGHQRRSRAGHRGPGRCRVHLTRSRPGRVHPDTQHTTASRVIPGTGSRVNSTWRTLTEPIPAGQSRTFTVSGTVPATARGRTPTVLAGAATTTPETNLAKLNNVALWSGAPVR